MTEPVMRSRSAAALQGFLKPQYSKVDRSHYGITYEVRHQRFPSIKYYFFICLLKAGTLT